MSKYLLTITHKATLVILTLAYIAYIIYNADSLAFSSTQFFHPYTKILFILIIVIALLLMKNKNCKNKMKILTLIAVAVAMFFVTSLQLHALFDFNSKIFKSDLTYEQTGFLAPVVYSQIYYRIGKIVLFDIFTIFCFWAINKTIDDVEIINE